MKRFVISFGITALLCVLLFHVNMVAFAEAENPEDIKEVTTEESTESATTETTAKIPSDDSYWLVLDSYNVSGNRLIAGNDSVLTLRIANKNSKLNATNVMITISGDSSSFSPQPGLSNQFFADSILAGTVKDIEIPIRVTEGVTGIHYLDVRIDYVYSIDRNDQGVLSNQFSISLPVYLSSIVTEEMVLSDNNDLRVKFLNSGSRHIYNVTAHISGDMSGTENFFIGNIDAGTEGEVSIPVAFLSSGNKNVKIRYSYKNDNGVSIQSDDDSFMVFVPEDGFNYVNDSEEDIQGLSVSFICIMIGCLIVIIGTVYYGLVGRKKKKVTR